MNVYEVTSMRYESPIGMPSLSSSAWRFHSGQQKCLKISNGANTSTRVSAMAAHSASAQLIDVLASAQPGPPNAGTPRPPKMSHVLSGTLSTSAPTWRNMTRRGRPTALASEL